MSDERPEELPSHLDGCTQKDLDIIDYIHKQPMAGQGSKTTNDDKYRKNYDNIKWGVYEKDSGRDRAREEDKQS